MPAGTTEEFGAKIYIQDSRAIETSHADIVVGTVVIRSDAEPDRLRASLTAGPQTQEVLGVTHDDFGNVASASTTVPVTPDSIPRYIIAGRNINCRIQDNATPALNDLLTLSGSDAGTFVTASSGNRVWAICSKAIMSGAVDQLTKVDILMNGFLAP